MFKKTLVCPQCGVLVSSGENKCLNCGYSLTFSLFTSENIVKVLIISNCTFFALSLIVSFSVGTINRGLLGIPQNSYQGLSFMGMFIPQLFEKGHLYTLVTATFLHADIFHILFNMLWLNQLGKEMLKFVSPKDFFVLYILAGVVGNLAAYVFTSSPVVGASGAVFGLFGALISQGSQRGDIVGRIMSLQYGRLALAMIFIGFLTPQISNSAHIGGLFGGYLIMAKIPLKKIFFGIQLSNALYVICIASCVYAFYKVFENLSKIFL